MTVIASRRLYIFYGNFNANHHSGRGLLEHKDIISAVKRVEFISNWMSYINLRDRRCDITDNVHAPSECKRDDMK
jgi:hypothetical protein